MSKNYSLSNAEKVSIISGPLQTNDAGLVRALIDGDVTDGMFGPYMTYHFEGDEVVTNNDELARIEEITGVSLFRKPLLGGSIEKIGFPEYIAEAVNAVVNSD